MRARATERAPRREWEDVRMIDVAALRREANARAASRPKLAFPGDVVDEVAAGALARRYSPAGAAHTPDPAGARRPASDSSSPAATSDQSPLICVFLHGGYGLFGSLDLQDSFCRRLAAALPCEVVALDYGLAPEHSFEESLAGVLKAVDEIPASRRIVLVGDSAGGTLAVAAAARLPGIEALVLTNPCLDLTLSSFDSRSPEGPSRTTLEEAILLWTGAPTLADAPNLTAIPDALPRSLTLVGSLDALVDECRAFSSRTPGAPRRLTVVEGAGHGFITDPAHADRAVDAIRGFLLGA